VLEELNFRVLLTAVALCVWILCCSDWKKEIAEQEAQLMLTNLRNAFRGQSRSPNIVPFHMLGIVSSCAIVTLSLRGAVFTTFDFKKSCDLEIGVRVHSRSLNVVSSIDRYSFLLVFFSNFVPKMHHF